MRHQSTQPRNVWLGVGSVSVAWGSDLCHSTPTVQGTAHRLLNDNERMHMQRLPLFLLALIANKISASHRERDNWKQVGASAFTLSRTRLLKARQSILGAGDF